jgi:hypothetical protein
VFFFVLPFIERKRVVADGDGDEKALRYWYNPFEGALRVIQGYPNLSKIIQVYPTLLKTPP